MIPSAGLRAVPRAPSAHARPKNRLTAAGSMAHYVP